MNKDVLLALKGMQFAFTEDGTGFPIELITNAQYYEKNDSRYLMYEEMMEGVDSSISNLVKFDDGTIEVTKKGVINVHMIFEEGKQNLTSYVTPYGTLMIGINTHKVEITETPAIWPIWTPPPPRRRQKSFPKACTSSPL